jgi:hypothetical protein
MKTIYLDSDFKCHLINDGTMTAIETDVFDMMCDEMIEFYRLIPEGEEWTNADGEAFSGQMMSPHKPFDSEVLEFQRAMELTLLGERTYELQNSVSLAEMDEAYREGVNSL